MSFNLVDARRNLDYLVQHHFPELKEKSIRVNRFSFKRQGMAGITYSNPSGNGFKVCVDEIFLLKSDENTLRGLLAHELGHVKQMVFLGLLSRPLYTIIKKFGKLNDWYEKMADKIAEKKGCSVYLHSLDAYFSMQ